MGCRVDWSLSWLAVGSSGCSVVILEVGSQSFPEVVRSWFGDGLELVRELVWSWFGR